MTEKPQSQEKTLVFIKFKKLLEQEIRNYWYQSSCQEYATRYLQSLTPSPTSITKNPGDDRKPFKSINISPADFIAQSHSALWKARMNALVGFVTIFEQYLFDTVERAIYLDPKTIDDSAMPFEARELCAIDEGGLKMWLANKIAEKYLRNKTHTEMMAKVDKLCLAGVSKSANAVDWNKWTLVRNSIVHTAGFATKELAMTWPEKFKNPGDRLELTDHDISACHSKAMELASTIDKMSVKNVVKKSDATLLARELFIQQGLEKPADIKKILNQIIQSTLTDNQIRKVISDQRKGILDRWSIAHGELQFMMT